MLIVKLIGGLGNQMFQYALGRRLSLKHNVPLKFDTGFLNDSSLPHIKREFELGVFNIPASVANHNELNKFYKTQNGFIERKIHRFLPFLLPYYIINESSHSFSQKILDAPANSLLNGFWQTEKYFKEIEGRIRNDFAFTKPLDAVNNNILEKINSCNSVSVHIRRGDYVTNPETSKIHGICGAEYYKNALSLLRGWAGDIHLFVFSDDADWVKQNMRFTQPATFVEHNTGPASYIDMQLMSMCNHNIIANSSFSWWGAWLNVFKDKVIIAPRKWFNDDSLDTSDVIPEGWIKI